MLNSDKKMDKDKIQKIKVEFEQPPSKDMNNASEKLKTDNKDFDSSLGKDAPLEGANLFNDLLAKGLNIP